MGFFFEIRNALGPVDVAREYVADTAIAFSLLL
jgi:hypothetical protein